MTTGKTIALTRWTFVGKVMSLLFDMLSRLVITFLPRSKRLLISWLQSPSVVILEPPKLKSATVSTVSPSICHEVMRLDTMILVFWMLSFKPALAKISPGADCGSDHAESSSFLNKETEAAQREEWGSGLQPTPQWRSKPGWLHPVMQGSSPGNASLSCII